jgi:hypothetical protein
MVVCIVSRAMLPFWKRLFLIIFCYNTIYGYEGYLKSWYPKKGIWRNRGNMTDESETRTSKCLHMSWPVQPFNIDVYDEIRCASVPFNIGIAAHYSGNQKWLPSSSELGFGPMRIWWETWNTWEVMCRWGEERGFWRHLSTGRVSPPFSNCVHYLTRTKEKYYWIVMYACWSCFWTIVCITVRYVI